MSAVVEFGFSAPSVFAGVSALEKKLTGLNERVNTMTGIDLGKMLPAASLAAGGLYIRKLMGDMDDLADAALRLNETTDSIQKVAFASEILAGVDVEGLSTSFLKLEKALGDVENTAAAKALKDLNITAGELTRMPLEQKVLAFADAFTTARNRGTGYNDILGLLGKSAGDLIPLFEQGGAAIQGMLDKAPVVAASTVQELADANDKLDEFMSKAKVAAANGLGGVIDSARDLGTRIGGYLTFHTPSEVEGMVGSRRKAEQDARMQEAADNAKRVSDRKNQAAIELERAAKENLAKESTKQDEKAAEARSRLDEQNRKAGLDEMTMARRIATISVEVKDAAAKEAAIRAQQTPDALKLISAESRRVTLQTELNQLQKQFSSEKEREAEAAKRTAEQTEREAAASQKKNADRKMAVLDTAMEYKILQAKAGGNERAIEAAEREARILERARSLQENNGLNKKEALALAIKMADLEDRANGKGSHIKAPVNNADSRGGLSREWQSGPSGSREFRGMGGRHGDPLSQNGGLNGFWDLQAGNTGSNRQPSDFYNQNAFSDGDSIQNHHRANAAAAEGTGNAGDNRMVDAFLDKLTARLPAALADAILSKS